jgi:geranylgeranyl pyrophosphate synthase
LAIGAASNSQKDQILKVYGSKKSSEDEIRAAVDTISTLGIESEVRSIARTHMTKSLENIESYPETEPKRALGSSARFIVERSL